MEKLRRVMIGTPTYDGKITIQYANALKDTILLGLKNNVEVIPVYVAFDALVQIARNNLMGMFNESDVDDLVFIDSDIGWNPQDFFKLLSYDVDIVGGTYRRKQDNPTQYVINAKQKLKVDSKGLIEVDGLGMGFCRITKKAVQKLWKTVPKYTDERDGILRGSFFEVTTSKTLISEDINFCKLWTSKKGKIYLDPAITCEHQGFKNYTGNFIEWLKNTINNSIIK